MTAQLNIAVRPHSTVAVGGNVNRTEDRVTLALEEYSASLDAGQPMCRESLLAKYSDVATELVGCLDSLDFIRQVAPQFSDEPGQNGKTAGAEFRPDASLGDFRIVREIGRGGMGVVYEAQQLSLGRRFALKVLPFAAMLDRQQLARFKNEARAAATLDHPNIVAVHSIGVDRGVHYYAMQLIEGQSLAEVVEQLRRENGRAVKQQRSDSTAVLPFCRSTALPGVDTVPVAALATLPDFDSREYYATIARLGVQAAEALDHAHQNGILHRDIKPANLLVDDIGKLWITDFGLARMDEGAGMTMTGDLLGTLRYMSPEQSLAKRVVVDHRSDIYSLGVTLYELLTLHPAYSGDDRQELLRKIAFDDPRPPRHFNSHIPQDVETIILKAIEKNPADRYATAHELADDLSRFLDNRPIVARAPSIAHRARKWAGRHIALISISAVALTVVTLACITAALLTLRAYTSEAQHRAAAVGNLKIASDSIYEMIARVADDKYFHGDLAHAEILAKDATKYYEKLLKHSNDSDLRFRAAEAYEKIAGIWVLVGQYEKAHGACLRSIELVRPLIASDPVEGKYLNARGGAYLALSQAEWGFDGSRDAQEPSAQAAADFELLIERFPHEPKYRGSLAGALNNLGMICWIAGRADEAEQCFKRSIEIMKLLPETFANTPEVWSAKAAPLGNWAMLARERGDTKRATELLDEAIALQKRSLDEWPTNPAAVDSLFSHYWHLGETGIRAGQHRAAAKAVESLVWAFPDQLRAYHYGAEQLFECAKLAEKDERMPQANATAGNYRQRGRELVALAHDAPNRTPDTTERFAWFLVTCEDESLRDPSRALELATTVVKEVPGRGDGWLTLALAHYRLGDWQAADDAMQQTTKLPHQVAKMHVCDWLMLAMLRHQQGRSDEARQWHKKSRDWLAKDKTDEVDILRLAAEAKELLDAVRTYSNNPTAARQ